MLGLAAAFVSALLGLPLPTPAADSSQDPETRLMTRGYLKPSERAALDAGGVIAKVTDILDRSEIRTLVVLRTTASATDFLRCAHDPQCFRRAGDFVAAGPLATPPALRDFERITLDDKERRYLAKCRVGDCDLRLSAEDIERFRTGVDWKAADREARADGVFHEMLLRYARSYIERGNAALPTYADRKKPTSGSESLNIVLERDSPIADAIPELRHCLANPPAVACPGIDRSLIWYKEKVWKATIIGLNDVAIVERSTPGAERVFVASKQIFASDYYNTSLEYAEYYRRPGAGWATVVYMGDDRVDAGADGFGAIERFLVRRLIIGRLKTWARSLETRMELAVVPAETPTH
jgi:hypothetical protein